MGILLIDFCSCSDVAVLDVDGVTATTVGLDEDGCDDNGGRRVADVAG